MGYKVPYRSDSSGKRWAMSTPWLFAPGVSNNGPEAVSVQVTMSSLIEGWLDIPDSIARANWDLNGYELVSNDGYNVHSVNTSVRQLTALQSPKRTFTRGTIAGLAKAHAEALLNEMNYIWITGDSTISPTTISLSGTTLSVAANTAATDRWRNTYYWILSAYAVVKHIDETSSYTDQQASDAWTQMQKLMPRGMVETWYRAHNATVWAAYFPRTGTMSSYFKWATGQSGFNDFASDAVSSTQWSTVTLDQGETIASI